MKFNRYSKWGGGRVTLIGDAAHPVLPSIGQGGCMAIEDAFELAKQLATITPTESVPSLLRQFESSRFDRVNRVFTTSRQVGRLGQVEHPIACFFRNWLYKLTPTWLADLQFKWLFDYRAGGVSRAADIVERVAQTRQPVLAQK